MSSQGTVVPSEVADAVRRGEHRYGLCPNRRCRKPNVLRMLNRRDEPSRWRIECQRCGPALRQPAQESTRAPRRSEASERESIA